MATPAELSELTLERFLPLVEQEFRLHAGDTELGALLVEARAVGQPHPDRRQPFSLIFTAPATHVLPQSIYRVGHASLGALDVFLVPVGLRDSRVEYQAVFN
jgi:hypothetical protein